MEKLIYLFLPSVFFINFYLTKADKGYEKLIKHLKVCFLSNVFSFLVCYYYFDIINLKTNLSFCFKYLVISIVINIVMVIIYKIINNIIKVKVEVVNDKKNKK